MENSLILVLQCNMMELILCKSLILGLDKPETEIVFMAIWCIGHCYCYLEDHPS